MHRAFRAAAILAALAAPAGADPRSSAPPADRPHIRLDWARKPSGDDLERLYPPEASARGLSGDTRISCAVEPDGTLVECDTLEERPAQMGFAAAGIRASREFRMTPYSPALVQGRLPRVVIPIHWSMAQAPAKAASPPRAAPTPQAAPEPFPANFFGFFPVYFLALWLAVTTLLGLLSGWYGLMRRYPDRREPELVKAGGLSGMMGIGVSLRGVLTLSACPSGLRVSIWRIFGPFSRSFFVPWREVGARPVSLFFSPMVRLGFGHPEVGVLSVDARAWERVAGAARQSLGSQAPAVHPVSEWRLIWSTLVQWIIVTGLAASFFYFAPAAMSPDAEHLPLGVCVGLPATVFGVGLLIRYLGQRRR